MERTLYGKFFDETRVAPRHIGVELDGKETYDVYYAFDTDSVFKAIQDGIANREFVAPTVVRGDRSIVERVASRDIADRKAVEKAYSQGDHTLRKALLEAAIEHPDVEQVDLLRSAVFGFDMELSSLARRALARTESKASVNLITEALRVPMDVSERDALIGALARLGESAPRARMLAVVHKGLSARSKVLDVEAWAGALGAVRAAGTGANGNASAAQEDGGSAEPDSGLARLENQNAVLRSGNGAAQIELAETFLASAYEQIETEEEYARCLFADARSTALEAEKCGAAGWRVDAVVGLAAFSLGDRDEADRRAGEAARAMPPGEAGWNAKGVLELFAAAQRRSIAGAVRAKRDWESWSKAFEGTGERLTNLHAAYSILARHPFGTDTHVVAHFDFLKILGAKAQAAQVLNDGLVRFPESWVLHDRLRGRILAEKGIDGLEAYYEGALGRGEASAGLESFAGYASFVAAEFRRRYGNAVEALAAYDRAIAHYERVIEADGTYRETADHFIALAIAGRSRLALERGDYETALDELLLSFTRREEAAATLDGLNISPADTARMLLSRLKATKRDDLVARLEEAMGRLDPELLRLPAYERRGPGGARPERDNRNRGRRSGERRMPRRNG